MNQNDIKKALITKLFQNLCKIIVFRLKNMKPYAIFNYYIIAHSYFTLKMINYFVCEILLSTIFYLFVINLQPKGIIKCFLMVRL